MTRKPEFTNCLTDRRRFAALIATAWLLASAVSGVAYAQDIASRGITMAASSGAAAVVAVSPAAPTPAVGGRTYRFGMVPWIAYSPLHVAEDLGLWRKLGVDVKVVSFPTNPALYRGIASGDVDLCMDMIGSMVGMVLDGVDVKVLGEADWSHGGDKIIVKRDLTLARLKARPIGVYLAKPSVTFFLNRFLKDWNLSLSDVRTQELTMQELADAFIDGRFNVIINCDPEALRAEHDGEGRQSTTSADFDGIIPEGFVGRADRVAAIPFADQVKIFRGWIQAVRWLHDQKNWAEFRRILNQRTFKDDGPFADPDLLDMFRSVRIHPARTQARRNTPGTGVHSYLHELHGFLRDNKLLARDWSVEKLLDNSALREALRQEGAEAQQ